MLTTDKRCSCSVIAPNSLIFIKVLLIIVPRAFNISVIEMKRCYKSSKCLENMRYPKHGLTFQNNY